MATVKGVWAWNDTIDVSINREFELAFTTIAIGQTLQITKINTYSSGEMIYTAIGEGEISVYVNYSGGWMHEGYKTINFGSTAQTVSDDFYTYLTANATPQSSPSTNLSDFLTEVAEAIRTKKGTSAQINAQDFPSEIASIETGVDTSNATAVAGDILLGETAYARGEKLTGTIPTYNGEIYSIIKNPLNGGRTSGRTYQLAKPATSVKLINKTTGASNESTTTATVAGSDGGSASCTVGGVLTIDRDYGGKDGMRSTIDSFEVIFDGQYSDTFTAEVYFTDCFVEGTPITLADGSVKSVEAITYEDDILVWDFDKGVQSHAKPCWMNKPKVSPCYWKITLSDGTVMKLVGANGKCHRIFNSRGKFIYPQDFAEGERTVKQDGSTPTIVSCEKVQEEVRYYNFTTGERLNNYANGVLCGCRFTNVYPIEDMKYVKDGRELAKREDFAEIPDNLFYGLRLAEQPNMDDSPDNVNYFHTMKEHVIHQYIEHEKNYTGPSDYKTWIFKEGKQ